MPYTDRAVKLSTYWPVFAVNIARLSLEKPFYIADSQQ
jgi:hypothetical protein